MWPPSVVALSAIRVHTHTVPTMADIDFHRAFQVAQAKQVLSYSCEEEENVTIQKQSKYKQTNNFGSFVSRVWANGQSLQNYE